MRRPFLLDGLVAISPAQLELLVEGAALGVHHARLRDGGTGGTHELLLAIDAARHALASCAEVADVALEIASSDMASAFTDDWPTTAEVAERQGVTPQAVRARLVSKPPTLIGVKHRGEWRVDPTSVQETQWRRRQTAA